jgi:AraC family ethanolamine operon transcriptional activator
VRLDPVERFATSDIEETNLHPPPGWTLVVYRLGEGPFRYEFVRVHLGEDLDVEHARFFGPTRVLGTLADDAVHVLFPYGRDLRLSGVPVSQRLVVISPPAVQFEASTQLEGCGYDIVARGRAYATLLGAATSPLLTPGRTAVVLNESPAAVALRQLLEGYFLLVDQREDLALEPQRIQRAREDMLDLLRLTLLSGAGSPEDEVKAPHPRRRALALAIEEWLWRQLDEPGAPPVTLAGASRELEVSIRSIQLAVEEYFGINFVRFARLARLHQVHSALVLGPATNVSEAATRHGFWHLGRFSRYYREVFGEPPSQTLRGARRRPATSAAVRRRLMRRTLEALHTGP